MKIALVSQEYPPETAFGGIGTQNHQKAHGLAGLGHDVYVISHSTDEKCHEYSDGEVSVIRIPGFDAELPIATDAARWVTYSTLVASTIAKLHAKVGLELVEFADWGSEGYVHLLNQTGWNHIPTVVHLHGPVVMFANRVGWPDPDSEWYRVARSMEKTCLRLADGVYSSSRCSADWCCEHYGLDLKQIPIIHTGIDTTLFKPIDVGRDTAPAIVFVGKLGTNKGVELLVEAGCHLTREFPNLRARFVGRGDSNVVHQMNQIAASAGCDDLIEILGFVPHEKLPQYLSAADIFAAPSVYEGGPGFVYLEAMACGLPVVCCEGSGVSEVITHGENGFLVPPNDLDALVDVLRTLISQPERRAEMGRRAVEYVRTEADCRVCIRRIESYYQKVASAGSVLEGSRT